MRVYVAIHRPQGFDHASQITSEVMANIDQVNDEMVAAGVRLLVGGFQAPSTGKAIHRSATGELTVTDGPLTEGETFVDGFWVLEVESLDEAVAWGQKAANACRGSVEVRPFHR